jgi:ubiquinone biosynthesis protein UbiJ
MFARTTIAALNHVLTQSGWGAARLAQFSGKTLGCKIAPFELRCAIQGDGLLCPAAAGAEVDAEFTVALASLPLLAVNTEQALQQVTASGDAALIETVFFLARNLKWDAAEDLSRVTGDIAAERITGLVRGARQNARAAARNLAQAAGEYWTEERPLLAKSTQVAEFAREVEQLDKAVGALARRVQRSGIRDQRGDQVVSAGGENQEAQI